MPAVHRHTDICTGHGCYPPRPNLSASGDVFVNLLGWHRLGDGWQVHCCNCCDSPNCHASNTSSGSSTVFVNSRAAVRVGDSVACGSRTANGSFDVFCGG